MQHKEVTLEDLGHSKGEISPYRCDFCDGPMAYLGVGTDLMGCGPLAEVAYVTYLICTNCGAGDIGEHFDSYLNPYFRKAFGLRLDGLPDGE